MTCSDIAMYSTVDKGTQKCHILHEWFEHIFFFFTTVHFFPKILKIIFRALVLNMFGIAGMYFMDGRILDCRNASGDN